MMTLENFILDIKKRILSTNSLGCLFYYFITNQQDKINQFNQLDFTKEVEKVIFCSFTNELYETSLLEKIERKLSKRVYRLNIYDYIGLYYQDKLSWDEENIFQKYIQKYYSNHSFRYKFLIAKTFHEFEKNLILDLKREVENQDVFIKILKYLYLEETVNIGKAIRQFQKQKEGLDIADLLLLETLRDEKSINYNRLHEKLKNDIIKIAIEIQSKHKTLNNDEDQYNSLFESLLTFSGYKTQPQTQRGQSSTGKSMGELDVLIFTDNDIPLSIFEAFKLKSTESKTITKHLKKLSEDYDPNGIKVNYAVIYSKADNFPELWKKYQEFVLTIDLAHSIIDKKFHNVTASYEQFAALKLGYTEHLNRESKVVVYHIFMDMKFE